MATERFEVSREIAAPPAALFAVLTDHDWSQIHERYRGRMNFPIIPEAGLRATLGALAHPVQPPQR